MVNDGAVRLGYRAVGNKRACRRRVQPSADRRLHPRVEVLWQPRGGLRRPGDMSRRFLVTAAALVALVALAGCGSSKPGSVQSSTALGPGHREPLRHRSHHPADLGAPEQADRRPDRRTGRELRLRRSRLGARERRAGHHDRRRRQLDPAAWPARRRGAHPVRLPGGRIRLEHRWFAVDHHRRRRLLATGRVDPGALARNRRRLGVVNRRRAALPGHLAGPGWQHRLDEPRPDAGPFRDPHRSQRRRLRRRPAGRWADRSVPGCVRRHPIGAPPITAVRADLRAVRPARGVHRRSGLPGLRRHEQPAQPAGADPAGLRVRQPGQQLECRTTRRRRSRRRA